MAVLRIIADTYIAKSYCDASLDEIAARAGVCRKTAQRALRRAQDEKLIEIKERPVRGRKNLTNLVRIVSREWLSWLEKRPRPIGGQICPTTDTRKQDRAKNKTTGANERPQGVSEEGFDGLHRTVFGWPATSKRACHDRLS
jgi:DNA-directed RNA polymerase specialized sigma24 family protein